MYPVNEPGQSQNSRSMPREPTPLLQAPMNYFQPSLLIHPPKLLPFQLFLLVRVMPFQHPKFLEGRNDHSYLPHPLLPNLQFPPVSPLTVQRLARVNRRQPGNRDRGGRTDTSAPSEKR